MKILGKVREDKSFIVFLKTKGRRNQGLHFRFKFKAFSIPKNPKKLAKPVFDIECLESQIT